MTTPATVRCWGDWHDAGDVKAKFKHVRLVAHIDGRQGVVKTPRDKREVTRKRFADEAREGWTLRSDRGVLTVLEIDATSRPAWFVMERADLLAEHLGTTPDLRDVVAACFDIADTLARHASANRFHRDIKPDNLFFRSGTAVVGDWGIGAFPSRSLVTQTGDGVGPAHFIAPEMRTLAKGTKFGPADVYSLAKTLFVLALPERGPYPPPGRHHLGLDEFSLYAAGQRDGHEIEGLLDAATNQRPSFRPSMQEFRDELHDWLQLTSTTGARRAPYPAFRRGFGPEQVVQSALVDRRVRALTAHMWRVGRTVAAALSIPGEQFGWRIHRASLRGDYGFDERPDFEPDGFLSWCSKYQPSGRRAVLGFELNDSEVIFYAECQRRSRNPSSKVLWNRMPPVEATVELPSCRARLNELADQLIAAMS